MPKESKIETGLVPVGSAELGEMLLEEAARHNRERVQQVVVSTLGELLIQISEQEKNLEALRNMHSAITLGQFEINRYGQIDYTDKELNKDVRWISRCGQCGYDKIVIAAHRGGY